MSLVVSPAPETLDELADLIEWDLKVSVSMPALCRMDIIHLVMVDLDTGLCGGAKLSQNLSFCSVVSFALHCFVMLRYASMHATGQRVLSSGKSWNRIGGLALPCLECLEFPEGKIS